MKIVLAQSEEAGWIGVDLDATLANYNGWKGIEHIGDPIPAMMARVKKWLEQGRKVKIMTARASDPAAVPYIKKWLADSGLPELEVTNVKDMEMLCLWDDKVVRVEANTGRRIK